MVSWLLLLSKSSLLCLLHTLLQGPGIPSGPQAVHHTNSWSFNNLRRFTFRFLPGRLYLPALFFLFYTLPSCLEEKQLPTSARDGREQGSPGAMSHSEDSPLPTSIPPRSSGSTFPSCFWDPLPRLMPHHQ